MLTRLLFRQDMNLGSSARILNVNDGEFALSCKDLAPDEVEFFRSVCRREWKEGRTAMAIPFGARLRGFFLDLDATVICEESLVEIGREIGKADEIERITEDAMAGRLDFAGALNERVALLRNLELSALDRVAMRLTLRDGITELCNEAQSHGVKLFLVTGGFGYLAEPLVKRLGFEGYVSNNFEVKNGKLTGHIVGPLIGAAAKADFVREKQVSFGWSPHETASLGDGANDIPMMKEVGIKLGINPKPILWPELDGAAFGASVRSIQEALWGTSE